MDSAHLFPKSNSIAWVLVRQSQRVLSAGIFAPLELIPLFRMQPFSLGRGSHQDDAEYKKSLFHLGVTIYGQDLESRSLRILRLAIHTREFLEEPSYN
jgi:hypothetical protein